MNVLLIIFAVIIAVIVVILIAALFIKKDYAIERSIVIERPSNEVFNYIKNLKNQDHYNKWVMVDPNMKKTYKGTDGTIGFVYAWDGNKKAGKGEQEIKALAQGERMDLEIRFERPFAGIANTPFIIDTISTGASKLRWGMSSRMKYPMNITLGFMNMDKLLGKDLETSLKNLKNILEKGSV